MLHGTGSHWAALTQDLFKLIGNDNLLIWTYDAPDALHRLMAYLRDDRLAYFGWLERGRAARPQQHRLGAGRLRQPRLHQQPARSPTMPGTARLRDIWAWMESQETTMISPRMFGQFFLPYMADVSRQFGLIYYGCCEPVHDRWDKIIAAIPERARRVGFALVR